MTGKNTPCEPAEQDDAAPPAGGELVLDTRFGTFAFDPAQAIEMSQGLLGFAEHRRFGLVQLPQPGYEQFMLLQCLTEADITFITLPLSLVAGLLKEEDLVEVCQVLEIAPDDLAVLLVVSIRKEDDKPQISVNLRAPVFLDVRNRTGRQYVMSNKDYPVRHVLNDAPRENSTADASAPAP